MQNRRLYWRDSKGPCLESIEAPVLNVSVTHEAWTKFARTKCPFRHLKSFVIWAVQASEEKRQEDVV